MIRNILIALTAAAAMGFALAPAAQAKTNLNLDVGFVIGGGGVYVGEPAEYGDGWDDEDCEYVTVKHKKKKANGTVKVWYSKELVCE